MLLFLIACSNNSYSFYNQMVFKAKIKNKSCTPLNSISSGIQISTNFGKTYGLCQNFNCQSGYTSNNGACIPSFVPNVTCATQEPSLELCAPISEYGKSFTAIAKYHNFNIIIPLNLSYNKKFYCPNLQGSVQAITSSISDLRIDSYISTIRTQSPANILAFGKQINGIYYRASIYPGNNGVLRIGANYFDVIEYYSDTCVEVP